MALPGDERRRAPEPGAAPPGNLGRFHQPSWSRVPGNCPRESWLTKRSSELGIHPAEAMTEKASFVLDLMETRLHGLGADWPGVTAVNIYTVHALERILPDIILKRIGSTGALGVHWFFSRPPIVGIEFEMDLRGRSEQDSSRIA